MATIAPTTASPTSTPTSTPASTSALTPAAVDVSTSAPASLRTLTVGVGLVAAVVTTAVAAALDAAGVSFEIDGEAIPLLGFAQMTFIGAVIGGVLAGSLRKRSAHAHRRFLQITVTLTALTCIPSVTMPPETGTKLALVLTHLVAAAIVIPVLARRLAD